MTTTKFDPFALVGTTLFKDLNRLLDLPSPGTAPTRSGWTPRIDVSESDEAFVVRAELAGVEPDHIDVTVEQGILTISGIRTSINPEEDDNGGMTYRRREIVSGEFARKIRLGIEFDTEGVSAKSANGILEVTVPKQPTDLPRKVTVAVQR